MDTSAFCVKCRSKQKWSGKPKLGKTKNNRLLFAGKCNKCGTKMTRFSSNMDMQGSGLIGKLLGLPGGKVPFISDIPLIEALI